MPTVQFDLQGAGKIPAEHAAIGTAAEKAAKQQEKLGQTWKANAAEAAKYDRLAKKIVEQNRSAWEKYNAQISDTRKALAGNAREQELLRKETTRLRVELLKEIDANEKLAKSRKEAAKAAKSAAEEIKPLTKETGEQATKAESVVTSIGKWAAGFATAHTALQLITTEMQKQQELIDKRAAAQLTVSESRNVALRNMTSKTDAERQSALAATKKMAADTGVSEAAINAGFASAVSASGGNVEASLKATEIAAKFLKDRPSELGEFAGSLLDLSGVTGTTDAKVNLGLLAKVGELGRVVDPALQARNIAPSLIGFQTAGGTAREAGALFAALSVGSADVRGERSGTAQIQLAEQLRKFQSDNADFQKLTIGERITELQKNPALAQAFLAKASFEAKSKGVIRDLLTNPESNTAKLYQQNLAQIPDNAGLAVAGQAALDVFKSNTLEPVAETQRAFESTVEQVRTASAVNSLTSEQRDLMQELMVAAGSTAVGAKMGNWVAGMGDGESGLSVKKATSMLEAARHNMAQVTDFSKPVLFADTPTWQTRQQSLEEMTPEKRVTAEAIDRLIEQLKNQAAGGEQSKTNEILERIDDKLGEGGLVGVGG